MFFALPLLFLVYALLFLIVEISTVMLVLTGLDRDTSRFQAISIITGSGYTTAESELVCRHPVRRKIAMFLMISGSIALAVIISILVSILGGDISGKDLFFALVVLLAIYLIFRSPRFIRLLDSYLEKQLIKQPYIQKRSVEELLKIDENFSIAEVQLTNPHSPWVDQTLGHTRLRDKGVMVLSVTRKDGTTIRAPRGTDILRQGDILLVYGRPRFITEVIEIMT